MSVWPSSLADEDFERMLRKAAGEKRPTSVPAAPSVKHRRGPNRPRLEPIITDGAVRRLISRLHAGLRP